LRIFVMQEIDYRRSFFTTRSIPGDFPKAIDFFVFRKKFLRMLFPFPA